MPDLDFTSARPVRDDGAIAEELPSPADLRELADQAEALSRTGWLDPFPRQVMADVARQLREGALAPTRFALAPVAAPRPSQDPLADTILAWIRFLFPQLDERHVTEIGRQLGSETEELKAQLLEELERVAQLRELEPVGLGAIRAANAPASEVPTPCGEPPRSSGSSGRR